VLFCKYCNKECKNGNSLRNHERLCKSNPDRQSTVVETDDFKLNHKRSNGAIKAKLEGRELLVSDETRKKISNHVLSRSSEWNKENGKRISKTVNEKVANGSWHTSLAKHMHIDYNGVDMHGNWELKYAIYLDKSDINWIKCKDSFSYEYEKKLRKYTPDFYLIDTDEYIEIKGYKTEKDDAKWSQFPKDKVLKVLMKNELIQLGIVL
jgi:hypothetical protein